MTALNSKDLGIPSEETLAELRGMIDLATARELGGVAFTATVADVEELADSAAEINQWASDCGHDRLAAFASFYRSVVRVLGSEEIEAGKLLRCFVVAAWLLGERQILVGELRAGQGKSDDTP